MCTYIVPLYKGLLEKCFCKCSLPIAKKPFLSDSAMELLQERDTQLARGNQEGSKATTYQFRSQLKRVKKEHMEALLCTFEGAQKNWPAIKGLCKKFLRHFSKRGGSKPLFLDISQTSVLIKSTPQRPSQTNSMKRWWCNIKPIAGISR